MSLRMMKNSGQQLLQLAADTQCCSKQPLLPFWTTDAAFLDCRYKHDSKLTYGSTMILQATSRSNINRSEGQDQNKVEGGFSGSWCRGGVSPTAHVIVRNYSQRVRLHANLLSPMTEHN